jgi:hypothetical protein
MVSTKRETWIGVLSTTENYTQDFGEIQGFLIRAFTRFKKPTFGYLMQ